MYVHAYIWRGLLSLAAGVCLVSSQDYLIAWDPCGGCLHGGTCVEFARKCLCPPTHYGVLCAESNPCPSYPIGNPNQRNACGGCDNGGVCFEAMRMCICRDGYSGKHCGQSNTTPYMKTSKHEGCKRYCNSDKDCLHEGRCLETARCECAEGYFGKTCELKEEWWQDSEESSKTDTVGVILASVPAVLITTVILPAAACFYCVVLRRSKNQGSVIDEDAPEHSEEDIINIEAGEAFSEHPYDHFDEGMVTENTRITDDMPAMYGSQDGYRHLCTELEDGAESTERHVVLMSPPSYDNVNMSPPDYESNDLPPSYQSRLTTPSSDVIHDVITPPPPYEE